MSSPLEIHSLTWNVTPDLLGILDHAGFFVETNPAWQHTLGWEPQEIKERTFFDFLHPDDISNNAKAFTEIKTGKPILNFENRYRHKDGTYRWLSWNAVPEGENFFCSARDISVAKQNAASLQSREQEAALREQFVAVLGHDLRNPLSAIRAAANIMKREEQSERTSEMLEAIDGAVDRMAGLLSDVMDFARSKLGSGLDVSTTQRINPGEVIQQVIDEVSLANQDREIIQALDFDDFIYGDETRLAQLASNLLANAITHGAATSPVFVELTHRDCCLELSVANAGEPIPPDKLKTIFEPFYMAEPGEQNKGLGLGLFIASQIAEAHGGKMSVDSNNYRTVFRFSMPTQRP